MGITADAATTPSKEKLVMEVVATCNLMPKDGEGSSSPFEEVETKNQKLRTQVRYKELNSIWVEKLDFNIKDVAHLLYRLGVLMFNVFDEKRFQNNKNLG
ncbi:hypothetical protein RCOM_0597610 [Ricinus communis]|uniref:C2 domain-containing protein n=1 Tax=Ricinus communis TaxID=3988 RepID=B9SJ17_RICCO|nr:hypothetical protein RCOM_0597610 [Ricinus communis]